MGAKHSSQSQTARQEQPTLPLTEVQKLLNSQRQRYERKCQEYVDKAKHAAPILQVQQLSHTPQVQQPNNSSQVQQPKHLTQVQQPTPRPQVQQPSHAPQVRQPNNLTQVQQPSNLLQVQQPTPKPQVQQPNNSPQVQQPKHVTQVQQLTPRPQLQQPNNSSQVQQPKHLTQVQQPTPRPQVQQPSHTPQVRQPNNLSQVQQPSNLLQVQQPTPKPQVQQPNNSPQVQQPKHVTQVQQLTPRPQLQQPNNSSQVQQPKHVTQVQQLTPRPQVQQSSLTLQVQQPNNSSQVQQIKHLTQVQQPTPRPQVQQLSHTPQLQQPNNSLQVQQPKHLTQVQQPTPRPQVQQLSHTPQVQQPNNSLQVQQPKHLTQVQQPTPRPQVQQPSHTPQVQQPNNSLQGQQPKHLTQVQQPTPRPQVQQPTQLSQMVQVMTLTQAHASLEMQRDDDLQNINQQSTATSTNLHPNMRKPVAGYTPSTGRTYDLDNHNPDLTQSRRFVNSYRQAESFSNATDSDKLNCSTCKTDFGLQIYQCNNRHNSCSTCKELRRPCGICGSHITYPRNIGLERYMADKKVPCPHIIDGCKLFIKMADIEFHVKECPFKELQCPLACGWKGKLKQLPGHFDDMHPDQRTAKVGTEVRIQDIFNDSQNTFLVLLGSFKFLFHVKISAQDRQIYMTAQLIGTKVSASKWSYEVHVFNKNECRRKYVFTDVCSSFVEPVADVFKESRCSILPQAYATTFVNNGALTYKFFIKQTIESKPRGHFKSQRGKGRN